MVHQPAAALHQVVNVSGQVVGHVGDIADVVSEDSQDGERGLEVGIVGVETVEVARIGVSIQISLAGLLRALKPSSASERG